MRLGELLTVVELRAMCRKVKMRHEFSGERQILELDVSSLDNPELFFNHVFSKVPSGSGMLRLDSFGTIFTRLQDTRIGVIVAVGPPEKQKTIEFLGQNMVIPTTKPGWLIAYFQAKSCRFA